MDFIPTVCLSYFSLQTMAFYCHVARVNLFYLYDLKYFNYFSNLHITTIVHSMKRNTILKDILHVLQIEQNDASNYSIQ